MGGTCDDPGALRPRRSARAKARGSALRRTVALALILLGAVFPTAIRAQPALERELRSALVAQPHAETRVGACVIDLATGKTVFTQDADTPLTPASSMKIFTLAAALTELGPEFTFETVLATDGTNLYVIGDGDPAFGDEKLHRSRGESIAVDFERWADGLLDRGMSVIAGDLVIDESIFDDQWVHPSWDEDDLDNWYAAPVGGLNFNDNCIDVTITPAAKRDALVLVSVQPQSSLVKIINKCRTGGIGTPVLHHPWNTFEYRIKGQCAKRWPFNSVSFPDPGLLFADSLRTVLAGKGISVSGTIRRGRVREPGGGLPASLTLLATRTTGLADVLRRAGKDSQNLFAECLLKRVGYAWAKKQGAADPQGSWSLGARAVVELTKRAGIDARGLVVADGSGLSRDNACSARQLTSLLAWMAGRGEGPSVHDSLSVAGVDGSLRKRLKDVPGRIVAKTGTMRGVRTLAGYVDTNVGSKYAFAVLFNGYKGPSTPYRKIQDRFCRILVEAATQPTGSTGR